MILRMPKPPSPTTFNHSQHVHRNPLKQNTLKTGDFGEVPESVLGKGALPPPLLHRDFDFRVALCPRSLCPRSPGLRQPRLLLPMTRSVKLWAALAPRSSGTAGNSMSAQYFRGG